MDTEHDPSMPIPVFPHDFWRDRHSGRPLWLVRSNELDPDGHLGARFREHFLAGEIEHRARVRLPAERLEGLAQIQLQTFGKSQVGFRTQREDQVDFGGRRRAVYVTYCGGKLGALDLDVEITSVSRTWIELMSSGFVDFGGPTRSNDASGIEIHRCVSLLRRAGETPQRSSRV